MQLFPDELIMGKGSIRRLINGSNEDQRACWFDLLRQKFNLYIPSVPPQVAASDVKGRDSVCLSNAIEAINPPNTTALHN